MEPLRRAQDDPSSEAVEFVRFCYRRRRIGWPEIYDEMCAVAGRGLFRGWTHAELGECGIGFSLCEMPALAALARQVIAEEESRRRVGLVPPGRGVTATAASEPGPAVDEVVAGGVNGIAAAVA